MMHQKVRKEIWGYAHSETMVNRDLIDEKYQGIRPAPGYPAYPDHTEKPTLFKMLGAEEIGMSLTESMAMNPAASLSSWHLAHTESCYFGLEKIQQDQLEDYSNRKGVDLKLMERWLSPSLF